MPHEELIERVKAAEGLVCQLTNTIGRDGPARAFSAGAGVVRALRLRADGRGAPAGRRGRRGARSTAPPAGAGRSRPCSASAWPASRRAPAGRRRSRAACRAVKWYRPCSALVAERAVGDRVRERRRLRADSSTPTRYSCSVARSSGESGAVRVVAVEQPARRGLEDRPRLRAADGPRRAVHPRVGAHRAHDHRGGAWSRAGSSCTYSRADAASIVSTGATAASDSWTWPSSAPCRAGRSSGSSTTRRAPSGWRP